MAKGGTGFKEGEVVSVLQSSKMSWTKFHWIAEDLKRAGLCGDGWKPDFRGLDMSKTSMLLKEWASRSSFCRELVGNAESWAPGPDQSHQNMHFNKSSRWFLCMFKAEKHSSGELGREGEERGKEGGWHQRRDLNTS